LGTEPTLFGKYTLLEVLGEGAMARVYRAIRSGPMGFQKEVALKLIHPEISSKEKGLRALINEARMGGLLRHRNVVEIYEFDQVGDTFYIAMELVRGWTLAELIRRSAVHGPLPPRIVTEIAAQICEGLDHAHGAVDPEGAPLRLVHRDLKPTNVMLSEDGVVKLADFGIARAATNVYRTSQGVTKGTPVYMSPEQVRGKALDHRSDLFSLASMVAEMVTGRVVFQDIKIYKVLQQVARADTTEVLDDVGQAMPELAPVLSRAFARMPADRPPDAGTLGRELENLHETLPGKERLRDWLPPFMGDTGRDPMAVESHPPDSWEDWDASRISISLTEGDEAADGSASVSLVQPPNEEDGEPSPVGRPLPDFSEASTEEAPVVEFVGGDLDTEDAQPTHDAHTPVDPPAVVTAERRTAERVTQPQHALDHPPPPPSRRGLRLAMALIGGLIALAAASVWIARLVGS